MAAGRHGGHREYDYRERDSEHEILRRRKNNEENERGRIREIEEERSRDRERGRDFRVARVSTHRDRDLLQQDKDFRNSYSSSRYSEKNVAATSLEKEVEREPGELSSSSLSENGERGYRSEDREEEVKKPERYNSPVSKKRKYSPIVWDLDEKPTSSPQKDSGNSNSVIYPGEDKHCSPLKLPPPPPLTASMRMALNFNPSTEMLNNSPAKKPSLPIKQPSPNTKQPSPSNSLLKPLASPVAIGSVKELSASSSSSEIGISLSRFQQEEGRKKRESDFQAIEGVASSDDEREPGQLPDSPKPELGEEDEPLMPRHISSSRWADDIDSAEETRSEDEAPKRKKRSASVEEIDDRRSSEPNGNKLGTSQPNSSDPSELTGEKTEIAKSKMRIVADESDKTKQAKADDVDDRYDMELNERELMDLDETDDDSTSQHADVESPEDPKKPISSEQTPQRMIDMLQGCRSVDEFERLNKIDEGTYGVVYRARNKKTGEIVALKKIKMEKEREGFPMTSLREINVLLSFHHPSIVDVKEVVVGSNLDSIFMVMEYMEHDLKGLMESMKQPFSQSEVKCLMLQLFDGVKYLHDNWVLHRDLKTSNLLLNNRGELKICDFGLARQYGSPLKPYTHMVVTLWYRAPELLLGAKQYSTAIDMWSLGCIMAELLAKEPLFNGKSEIDQLDKIFRTLGTPNEKIWPDFANLPGVKCNFVKQPYNKLRDKFPPTSFSGRPTLSERGFDLLNRLLTYDPKKRITAEEALRHDWFKEVPLPKSKEFMPTFPARHDHDSRRLRRILKSPDPLEEQRRKELLQGELGAGGLFS
eukprot:TRINITY_DN1008_c0_g1_i1.p1 TRINITY_DN1008_c0_g1~~TRINITY_DN1008_c0_g1_i1.p1  ORF type:complete len:816 (-),score=171.29 TRINITY_DN1008_c0_g1_i1:812-3259(-)